MDPDTKKAMGTNVSKPLNMPEVLFVEEDPAGSPIAVKARRSPVASANNILLSDESRSAVLFRPEMRRTPFATRLQCQ